MMILNNKMEKFKSLKTFCWRCKKNNIHTLEVDGREFFWETTRNIYRMKSVNYNKTTSVRFPVCLSFVDVLQ